MSFQKPGPRERLATRVTLVVEAVGKHVHGEGGHADVHLAADPALLGCARGEAQVSLFVPKERAAQRKYLIKHNVLPRKIAAGGVVLATLCALVLGLVHVVEAGPGVLAPPVAGKEALVGVGRGLAFIEAVHAAARRARHWGLRSHGSGQTFK